MNDFSKSGAISQLVEEFEQRLRDTTATPGDRLRWQQDLRDRLAGVGVTVAEFLCYVSEESLALAVRELRGAPRPDGTRGLTEPFSRAAFQRLVYERCGPEFPAVFRRLGVTNAAESEELVAGVRLRLLQNGFARYAPEMGRAVAYCCQAARNLCIDYLTRRRPSERLESSDDVPAPVAPEAQDACAWVWEALSRLPEDERAVLELILQGCTEQEVSEELGVPPWKVHQLKRRAMERLRKFLSDGL